jgi:hypothetical protein
MRPSDDAPSRVTILEFRQGDRTVRAPLWISPGHAPDTVTLHVGYGRARAGQTGTGIGFQRQPAANLDESRRPEWRQRLEHR